ncbi:MAG: lysine biosynthesis protein LysW [Anaerolineae bacterium]|jgi:alpha-aminoadipate carrier protein LysW
MAGVYCPDCDGRITINPSPRVGKRLTCPHCDADLEVISVDPVELDWVYEESDDDWLDEED